MASGLVAPDSVRAGWIEGSLCGSSPPTGPDIPLPILAYWTDSASMDDLEFGGGVAMGVCNDGPESLDAADSEFGGGACNDLETETR